MYTSIVLIFNLKYVWDYSVKMKLRLKAFIKQCYVCCLLMCKYNLFYRQYRKFDQCYITGIFYWLQSFAETSSEGIRIYFLQPRG